MVHHISLWLTRSQAAYNSCTGQSKAVVAQGFAWGNAGEDPENRPQMGFISDHVGATMNVVVRDHKPLAPAPTKQGLP